MGLREIRKVKWTAAGSSAEEPEAAALARRPPPADTATDEDYLPLVYAKPRGVDVERVESLPACQSPFVPEELADAGFYDVVEDYGDAIGAWSACWLLGHVPEGDWIEACGPDDQLLLKLSSHNRVGFSWGDVDTLYFVIPTEDLAARCFDRVRVNCGLG